MTIDPTLDGAQRVLAASAANAWRKLAGGGVADLRRLPASIVREAPQCTVYRYRPLEAELDRQPILLVPPLAGSSRCYDLRRGQSLAEHLLSAGHPTYLLEYGPIAFADRALGLEHWVDDVIPEAVAAAAADVEGRPVHLVSWSLGGILSLLAAAAHPRMPLASVTAIASAFDVTKLPFAVPARAVADALGGTLAVTLLIRTLGIAPQPVVRRAFQIQAFDKQLTKPFTTLLHLHDRDYLASIEAVDQFVREIEAYPGRTVGQLVHLVFRGNHLAGGCLHLGGRTIDLADVTAPVLAIAGDSDPLAPGRSVHHVADLLPHAAEVRLLTAPGGHLGVLAGRSAKDTTWRAIEDFVSTADAG